MNDFFDSQFAIYGNVFAECVQEALHVAVQTPRELRAAKIMEIELSFKDRLIARGLPPERAEHFARGFKIDVEVASDFN